MTSAEIEKVCYTKVFSLSVSHPFHLFFQKIEYCLPKIAYIGGERDKLRTFSKKWKVELLDDFSFPSCTKSSEIERVMIVQTHANRGFSLFSPQRIFGCEK